MLRTKVLKDTLVLNAASTIGLALSVLRSFFVMRFLLPGSLGVWVGLGVLISYAASAHLGLSYGMGMRLPYYKGRGDLQRARACEDSAYLGWTILGLCLAATIVVYAVGFSHSRAVRWCLLAIAVMVPLDQQSDFHARWQTSAKLDFNLGSYISIAKNLTSFAVIIPLAIFFGVVGVVVGTLIASAIAASLWLLKSRYRYRGQVSAPMLRELFGVGLPVLLTTFGGVLVQTIDRLVIAARLGATSLGYYGATTLGGAFLFSLLSQAGSALGPHIFLASVDKASGPGSLEKFLVKPTIVMSYLASVGLMMFLFVVPTVIRLALPRYVPGIPAVYAFLPGFFFLAIILTAGNILANVLIEMGGGRIMRMVYVQIVGVLIELACALFAVHRGWGITGVALASTLAYAAYGWGILWMTAAAVIPDHPRRRRFLFHVVVPFGYCAVAVVIGVATGRDVFVNPVGQSAIGLLIGTIAMLPLTYWMIKRYALVQEFQPIILSVRSRFLGARTQARTS